MEDKNQLLKDVLNYIKSTSIIVAYDSVYKAFFSPISLREISESPAIAYLEAPNMAVTVVKTRYLHLFAQAFSEILNDDYKVVIKTPQEYASRPISSVPSTASTGYVDINIAFNDEKIFDPAQTFDNFVIGDSNNFAAAMCKAVADSPSDLYNPLYLHGSSGLGKTHLLNAVGIYILQNHPNLKVLYVTAETFTNDFINSLMQKKQQEFKDKYRRADVLLMDDIQFLENKLKTQDEFYFTFDSLLQDNKQIIVSGDRSPVNLNEIDIDERLWSRFMMNTTVSIDPPDYETRIAILRKKADLMQIDVTEEILEIMEFIADKFKDNIRSLTGSFETVINVSREIDQDPSLTIAKTLLKDMAREGSSITPQKIKSVVAKHYNIKVSDLESISRKAEFAYPRQIAMYLCRIMTDYSLPRIGTLFGNKHYSTVKHACDKIDEEISIDKKTKEEIDIIREKISL